MSAVAERLMATISLRSGCDFESCSEFAYPLYKQLASGDYTWPASVMELPESIEEWEDGHRTARKRANGAERFGYRFAEIAREEYVDDIYAVNTSAEQRQGRPMSESYRTRPDYSPLGQYECPLHAVYTYGVLDMRGHLRAYTWVYRASDLVMFSSILGHADDLKFHIMYLLVRGTLEAQIEIAPGFAFYNRHDSGQDGLRFFKERLGFRPTRIQWEIA